MVLKYNDAIDRESAYEILEAKLNNAKAEKEEDEIEVKPRTRTTKEDKPEPSVIERMSKNTMVRQEEHDGASSR